MIGQRALIALAVAAGVLAGILYYVGAQRVPVVVAARDLDAVAVAHPALERRIRDEQGRLRRHVNVFVDGSNVRDLEALATPLPEGSEVVVLPAVSGG